MAVTVITKATKRRRFLAYDLEWQKGESQTDHLGRAYHHPQARMAGVYDGDRYRWYRTIGEFLDAVLVKANRGCWFYAHAGGLADMLFVLEVLADRPQFSIEAAFSGSSAIIVHVRRGKHSWHFVDSLWLLKDKLANIAKSLGMEKGDVSFDTASLQELAEYNEQDCRILWHAIDRFESSLLSLGGQLQMTLASSAMYLFRRRYLGSQIVTSEAVNETARKGYYASRVEVFQKRCEKAYYYDINSSFPYSMTFPCPGKLLRSHRTFPLEWLDSSMSHGETPKLFLADVEVHVPEMDLPPLPARIDQSLYFPTGTWRGWYTDIDLSLLYSVGGNVEKCHEVLQFEPRTDLSDYASDLYARRLAAKERGDTWETIVYKYLLNSLYGKFAEGRVKSGLVIHPDQPPSPWDESADMHYLFPGAYMVDREVDVPHCHVPISVHITSRSRRFLYDHMRHGGDVYYCDTDGFACSRPDVPTDPGLGGLKLETVIDKGVFHRPKVYMIEDSDGQKKPRAKGFTLRPDKDLLDDLPENEREEYAKAHSVERFMELLQGREIEMRRFVRVRELWKQGQTVPTERTIGKRFRDTTREKRKLLPDKVHTRPWDMSELVK